MGTGGKAMVWTGKSQLQETGGSKPPIASTGHNKPRNMAQIRTEKMRVTPTMAQEWLLKNTFNRPVNGNHVDRLARDMATGNWPMTGDTIKFAGDRLIDGQHRLMACVRAKRPFDTLVVYGLNQEVFDVLDTGNTRGASDIFSIAGEKHCTSLPACLNIVHLYYEGKAHWTSKLTMYGMATNRAYQSLLEMYDVRDSVRWAVSHKTPLVPVSIMSGCHFILSRVHPEQASSFMQQLATGTGIRQGSPMQRLMSVLTENAASRNKMPRGQMLGMILNTWNAVRSGRNITRMRATDGVKYPEAV